MVPIACRASMRWGNFCWTWSLVNHLPRWRSWPILTIRYSYILYWKVFLICVSMIWSVVACSMQFWLSSVGVICSVMSGVSNNYGKYGRRQSTLNTRCRPRNDGTLSSKALSSMTLVMVCGPYWSGWSLRWGPTKRSFYKCSQTLSPPWNLCNTRCWSWHCLYLELALSNRSWTCWRMCWMCSMKLLSLSSSG